MSLLQLIKQSAKETFDSLSPLQLVEAVVVEAPPNLKIKLKDNDKLILTKEFLVVAEHLTRHTRIVTLKHYEAAERQLGDKVEKDYCQSEFINDDLSAPYTSFSFNFIELQFEDVLKKDDKVLVAAIQGGQSFYIVDRWTEYE
ncbi:DUF2577 domain-containing protein [Metabacillus fastidiosus]|uniref:DUF2577 domain-containing protein n=1 Tax=Metabacillus fastidiosus TaxID=1458 RepID=UPI003D2A2313